MASNSATKLATQQSIKAYVDAQVGSFDTLSEVLAQGNTSGTTNLVIDSGQVLTTNTVNETTAGSGVTIDSVLLKDDVVNDTSLNVDGTVTIDGLTVDGNADVNGTVTADAATIAQASTLVAAPTLTLESVGRTWTGGEDLGSVDWYNTDPSGAGPANAARIYVENKDAASNALPYANMLFQTSPSTASVLDRMQISGGGDISFYEDTGTTPKFFWDASVENLSLDSTGAYPLTISRNGGTDSNTSIRFKQLSSSWYAGVSGSNNFGIGTTADIGVAPFKITSGVNAGNSIIAGGSYNTLVGDNVGSNITTANGNTFVGYAVGYDNTSGHNNVAMGSYDAVFGQPTFRRNSTVVQVLWRLIPQALLILLLVMEQEQQ
jgi:hypothetical protein